MSEVRILGLFHEATPTADAIDALRQLGVADENITVMSGMPYRGAMLGRPRPRGRVGLFALVGSVIGLLAGLLLTVGIFLAYPLHQGGQPVVPIPPTLIVLFELTMLGTMWAAFFSLLRENRFPIFQPQVYDPRITEGHIGLLAEVAEDSAEEAERILTAHHAHHLQRSEADPQHHRSLRIFWLAIIAGISILAFGVLLVAYNVLEVSFPTNMEHQDSIAYEQGPRRSAPPAAIPVQGPVLIAEQPATEPVAATDNSLQRGQVLFRINCMVCHGEMGQGDGHLSGFFDPKPADLTGDDVKRLTNDDIFLVITQGRGRMPSLAENLSVTQRWDVINHVRSLEK